METFIIYIIVAAVIGWSKKLEKDKEEKRKAELRERQRQRKKQPTDIVFKTDKPKKKSFINTMQDAFKEENRRIMEAAKRKKEAAQRQAEPVEQPDAYATTPAPTPVEQPAVNQDAYAIPAEPVVVKAKVETKPVPKPMPTKKPFSRFEKSGRTKITQTAPRSIIKSREISDANRSQVDLSKESVRKAVVMKEVLDQPKALS